MTWRGCSGAKGRAASPHCAPLTKPDAKARPRAERAETAVKETQTERQNGAPWGCAHGVGRWRRVSCCGPGPAHPRSPGRLATPPWRHSGQRPGALVGSCHRPIWRANGPSLRPPLFFCRGGAPRAHSRVPLRPRAPLYSAGRGAGSGGGPGKPRAPRGVRSFADGRTPQPPAVGDQTSSPPESLRGAFCAPRGLEGAPLNRGPEGRRRGMKRRTQTQA